MSKEDRVSDHPTRIYSVTAEFCIEVFWQHQFYGGFGGYFWTSSYSFGVKTSLHPVYLVFLSIYLVSMVS